MTVSGGGAGAQKSWRARCKERCSTLKARCSSWRARYSGVLWAGSGLLSYVLLLALGCLLIARRGPCGETVLTRDLPANHLIGSSDLNSLRHYALACPAPNRDGMVGRYLPLAGSKGAPITYGKTLLTPRIRARKGEVLYWVAVPETVPLEEIEPGAVFDACNATVCPLPGLRSEGTRCYSSGKGRVCEVAVLVEGASIEKLQALTGSPYRLLFRQ